MGALAGDHKPFKTKFQDEISLGTNVNLYSKDENYMINRTVGYITQLCNTENVQR